MAKRPLFEIVQTTMGATSIRNNVVNEIMHNPVGPWKEANALYIDQSDFRTKIRLAHAYPTPFTVFDVGLGAGANAIATLIAYQEESKLNKCAPLTLVSYEIDLRLIEFTLKNADHFKHYQNFKGPLAELLEKRIWKSENMTWILREGDFTRLIDDETEKADLIFYDAYSPKVNTEMWTLRCFSKLFDHCWAEEKEPSRHSSFYTYSRSTPVRTALLAAGFYVGLGQATGLKEETTQAATSLDQLKTPLDQRWYGRWQRSTTPYPTDVEDHELEVIQKRLESHAQIVTLQKDSLLKN